MQALKVRLTLRARVKITSHFMHPKGICFAAHLGVRPSSESTLTCANP